MEVTYGIGLALLEMTFIFVGLLILHGLRRIIGSAGFYIALGLLMVFTQIVGAANLKIVTGVSGLDFYLSSSILLLPSLVALMVVYVADGTLAAQRLIIGLMATLGLYVYLAGLTASQAEWGGYVVSQGPSADILAYLMRESMQKMAAMVLAFTVDLFLLPILYQRFRNLNCHLFVSVLGALMIVQILDSAIYSTVCFWGSSQWWEQITLSYISRAFFAFWLSIIAGYYLTRMEYEAPGESRRTLDIIMAFFGTYNKAKVLEQHLYESEERYKHLFQKASDMIVIMDMNGIVADANRAAEKICGKSCALLAGKSFADITGIKKSAWAKLLNVVPGDPDTLDESSVANCSGIIPATGIQVDVSIGISAIANTPMLIAFGRDVTEKLRIEREREEWRIQSSHKQRLESIGQLAGGIAHDFNNYLHAIQGHLDIIKYMCPPQDEEVSTHLEKIDAISTQAATLTSQLLGFARKGRYQEAELELGELLQSAASLFIPNAGSLGMGVRLLQDNPDPIRIKGDRVQLQQLLLNLMFNARDAMSATPEHDRHIILRSATAAGFGLKLDPPADLTALPVEKYCIIRVEDAGAGIPENIRNRIFEPFFTTKPIGKGTGMGLSMAYGTAMGHNGWIQCENLPEGGAAFTLVLPILPSSRKNS